VVDFDRIKLEIEGCGKPGLIEHDAIDAFGQEACHGWQREGSHDQAAGIRRRATASEARGA